jgi:hypothetical protein
MKKILSIIALNVCLSMAIDAKEVSNAENITSSQTKQQSANIINISGRQRMLTQKMSKEALFIAKKINIEKNIQNLKETTKLFESRLQSLINGDVNLSIPKTTDRETLAQLTKVSALWTLLKLNMNQVIERKATKETFKAIASDNIFLLKSMEEAVEMYTIKSNFYKTDPKLAEQINLSGRQRMLTQKMTKELLLVANDINIDENRKNTQKTGTLFEVTLKELMDNTKDEEITKQLYVVAEEWAKYRTIIKMVNTSENSLNRLDKLNMPLLKEMNIAVEMYEKRAKQ